MFGEGLRVGTEEGDSRLWDGPASDLTGSCNDPSYLQYPCIHQLRGEEDFAGGVGSTQTLNSVHNWGYVFRVVPAGLVEGAGKGGMLGSSGVSEGGFITRGGRGLVLTSGCCTCLRPRGAVVLGADWSSSPFEPIGNGSLSVPKREKTACMPTERVIPFTF